jgi:hypothetical protein
MKITLTEWAARRYSPPPSPWVLRRWARDGELHPMPELVGKAYYTGPAAAFAWLAIVASLACEPALEPK